MKIILAILFIITSVLFGQTKDTTVTVDLNFDSNTETVKFRFEPNNMSFKLSVNNNDITGTFFDSYDADVKIIDLNRNDGLREIQITGYGNSDQSDMHFYQFVNGKIVEVGHLPSNFGIEVKGNSEITEYAWMGFWTAKLKYEFDYKKKSITKIDEEFYDVGQVCEVKNSFTLLKSNKDNMDISAVLKPGTKLYIIKADLTPKCNYDNGDPDDFTCDWYYFETDTGEKGWCRLKNFQENVDGLIWAG